MPRYDMVDISNNNGTVTTTTLRAMKSKGVKAIIAKVSEGTYFYDTFAKGAFIRAKAVGLAIHGYHFARFTTVLGAQAEARFAVKCARLAGLPKGSVLVCDFESSNQGWSQNGKTTTAFKKIVVAAGYRYDLYTMGSWTGSVSINNSGRAGWIAQYPYTPAGKSYYSGYNSWQWTSTAKFAGSGSHFDVSQNYSSFYYIKSTKAKSKKATYFDWVPFYIFTKQSVKAYKDKAKVGTGKSVSATYKKGQTLHPVERVGKRFKLSNGLWITANQDYVNNVYYVDAPKVVKSANGTSRYSDVQLKHKVDTMPKGTEFDVSGIAKDGHATRLKLSNGYYISGNKRINKYVQ